ncbi:MAG: hypothetical protein AAF411_00210 [Myxococcota bacterium]
MLTRLCLSFALLSTAGCTNNATFDGEVLLPALPAGFDTLFMRASVSRGADGEFAVLPEGAALAANPQPYNFSLVTESFDGDVNLKLEFCQSANCDNPGCSAGAGCGPVRSPDPIGEVRMRIETPFYQAKMTDVSFDLVLLPACLDEACSEFTDPDIFEGSFRLPEDTLHRWCDLDATDPSGPRGPRAVWNCLVERCDVRCSDVAGDALGGSCQDGRSGPHRCE